MTPLTSSPIASGPSTATPAPPEGAALDRDWDRRWSLAVLAAMLAAATALFLWSGRDTSPFYDEWSWIVGRRGHAPDVLLQPHNGHLSLVPVLVYKALLQIAGISHYWVFRLVTVGLHLLCGGLVFAYARRRVGAPPALAAAALVLFLGAGSQDVLWAFQIGFLLSVVCGIGMLLALESSHPRSDLLASVLLATSLASSALGLVVLAGGIVELVAGRRARRWWVVGVPIVLYAAWYLHYGQSELQIDNVPQVPSYGAEMASAAVGGLLGFGPELGRSFAIVAAVMLVVHLARARIIAPRMATLVALPLVLWSLTALARADLNEPHAGRYVYPGAVLVLLLVVEIGNGQRVTHWRQAVVGVVIVAVAIVGGLLPLRNEAGALRENGASLRAAFGAAELLGDHAPPDLVPSQKLASNVNVAVLRGVQADFGTIATPAAGLPSAPAVARSAADATLLEGHAVSVDPGTAPTAVGASPSVVSAGVASPVRAGCSRTSGSPGSPVEVRLAPGQAVTVRSSAPTDLLLRRFADAYPTTGPTPLPARQTVVVRALPDDGPGDWKVQLSGSVDLRVCAVAG